MKKSGPKTEIERRAWLKDAHSLGTNYAWWIAERAEGKGGDEDSPEAYLGRRRNTSRRWYSGKRAALRPIDEKLLAMGLATWPRSEGLSVQDHGAALPCRASPRSSRPPTTHRSSVSCSAASPAASPRIAPVRNGKGNRISHRIPITSIKRWMGLSSSG